MSIIDKRQSVRKFDDRPVEREKIISMVQAGLAAPSSKNKQPFQFIVVDDRNLILELSDGHPNWKGLKTAQALIVACGDVSRDERDAQRLMAVSAATQNMMLRAVELELGTVWIGMYPDQSRMDLMGSKLGLPDYVIPISIVSIGYKEGLKDKVRAFDEAQVRFNKWEEVQ